MKGQYSQKALEVMPTYTGFLKWHLETYGKLWTEADSKELMKELKDSRKETSSLVRKILDDIKN